MITTFTKPNGIILLFPDTDVSLYRKEAGKEWVLLGTFSKTYSDNNVTQGKSYRYKTVKNGTETLSNWIWCTFIPSYGFIIQTVPGSKTKPPVVMARVYDREDDNNINPADIKEISYTIDEYMENVVCSPFQTKSYKARTTKDIEDVIYTNLVLDKFWDRDEYGYNFLLVLDELRSVSGSYIVKVEIKTTDDIIEMYTIIKVS